MPQRRSRLELAQRRSRKWHNEEAENGTKKKQTSKGVMINPNGKHPLIAI
jgi:hypothetical protein